MLCFGLQETTLSCGSALYRSQSPGKSKCAFIAKRSPAGIAVRSPSSHAKSTQSQPNLPAHPAAAGSHAKSTRRTALARFATAGHCNRRSSQPQPGQLALYQRHSAFGAAPCARQAIRQAPRTKGVTYARRGGARQNSGQNLVEGFAGAGVGVDRASQVGGGQALLDG